MGEVLQFTLGLEVSKFLEELGVSARELLSFTAIAEGLHFVMEKTFAAIEKGGALASLAARTRESVGSLYELQQGLEAVGLTGDNAGGLLLRTQKAIS